MRRIHFFVGDQPDHKVIPDSHAPKLELFTGRKSYISTCGIVRRHFRVGIGTNHRSLAFEEAKGLLLQFGEWNNAFVLHRKVFLSTPTRVQLDRVFVNQAFLHILRLAPSNESGKFWQTSSGWRQYTGMEMRRVPNDFSDAS
ncbi:MAG: hypothetical protein ACFCD0_02330 [Gemmataceae bacterium]